MRAGSVSDVRVYRGIEKSMFARTTVDSEEKGTTGILSTERGDRKQRLREFMYDDITTLFRICED